MITTNQLVFPKDKWNLPCRGKNDPQPLIDTILDFYISEFKEIARNFRNQRHQDYRMFSVVALEMFIKQSRSAGGKCIQTYQREALSQTMIMLRANYAELWDEYKQDPEYKQALAESWNWVKGLKKISRKGPESGSELDLFFGACESMIKILE